MIQNLSIKNFDNMVDENKKNKDKILIIDFYAVWCGPCKLLSPIIEKIGKEYDERIDIGKVNIDEEIDLAVKYEIVSIPTLLFIKNGIIQKRVVGLMDIDEIRKILNNI